MSGKVHVMDHPLVAHKLTILRDKDTTSRISGRSSPRSGC